MGRAFGRSAIGALILAAASVTGMVGVISPAAAADPAVACIPAAQARFGGDWNPANPATLAASLQGAADAVLCDDVVLNVSVYALPATWDGQGWNPTAAPQTLIAHGQNLVFPKGATVATMLTTTVASVPCVDFQIDLYGGPKVERVTYPEGHGSAFVAGGLLKVDKDSASCVPPTPTPTPATTPSTTPSTTASTTTPPTTTTAPGSTASSTSPTVSTSTSTAPASTATSATSATSRSTSSTSTTTVAAATTTTRATVTPVAAGLAFTGVSDGLAGLTIAGVVLLLGGVAAMGLVATRRRRARHLS